LPARQPAAETYIEIADLERHQGARVEPLQRRQSGRQCAVELVGT
jgi:hypothetical protein